MSVCMDVDMSVNIYKCAYIERAERGRERKGEREKGRESKYFCI